MKIDRKELIAALAPIKPALQSRSSVKELSHIWFDEDFAYAHDGGLGIRVALETPFKFGVLGSLLLSLLEQPGPDSLTLEAKDDVLSFKVGKSSVKLTTLSLTHRVWPYPDKLPGKPTATLKVSEALVAGIKRVMVVRVSSPRRMEHHGICVYKANAKEIDLYTTDSNVLSVAPVAEPIVGKLDKTVLPRAFAEQLVSQCKVGATLNFFDDFMVAEASKGITLYSNVFDTTGMLDLPEYADKLSDKEVAPPFKFPPDLTAALERSVLMAGSEAPVVRLSTSGKVLKLSGHFKNRGELDEEFALSRSVPKCSISVMARALLLVKGAESFSLQTDAATLIGDDGFMYFAGPYKDDEKPERVSRGREDVDDDIPF